MYSANFFDWRRNVGFQLKSVVRSFLSTLVGLDWLVQRKQSLELLRRLLVLPLAQGIRGFSRRGWCGHLLHFAIVRC